MGIYNMGEAIKRRRISLGITQEQLSEGVCSVQTLSRLENGKHQLSWGKFERLMERLGIPSKKYNSFIKVDSMQNMRLKKEIDQLINKHKYEEAEKLLRKLEKELDKKEKINYQYILKTQAILGYCLKQVTLEERRRMLENAIKLTVPYYGNERLKNGIYSRTEVIILCNIAMCLAEEGDIGRAIKFLRDLQEYLEKVSVNDKEYRKMKAFVLNNLSHWLERNGDYEESKMMGNIVIEESLSSNQGYILLSTLYNQLYIMSLEIKKGETVEGYKRLAFQVYYLSDIFGNNNIKMYVKEKCQETSVKFSLIP